MAYINHGWHRHTLRLRRDRPAAQSRWQEFAHPVLCGVVYASLAYPGLAICLLVYRVARTLDSPIRNMALDLIIFAAACGTSIALSVGLNYLFRGQLGLGIATWRNAAPTARATDVLANSIESLSHYVLVMKSHLIQVTVWLASSVYLFVRVSWRLGIRTIIVLGLCVATDLAIMAVVGSRTPVRGYIWLPFALALPLFLMPPFPRLRLGYLLLIVGLTFSTYGRLRDTTLMEARQWEIVKTIADQAFLNGVSEVFVRSTGNVRGLPSELDVAAKLHYYYLFNVVRCAWSPDKCEPLKTLGRVGIFPTELGGAKVLAVELPYDNGGSCCTTNWVEVP